MAIAVKKWFGVGNVSFWLQMENKNNLKLKLY